MYLILNTPFYLKGANASLNAQFRNSTQSSSERTWKHNFWKVAVAILIAWAVFDISALVLRQISVERLVFDFIWITFGAGIVCIFEYLMRNIAPIKIKTLYSAMNYYARAVVLGFLLWFGNIIVLGLTKIGSLINSSLGIFFPIFLLAVCIIIGFYVNKWQFSRAKWI